MLKFALAVVLIFATVFTVSSFAAPVNVTRATYQVDYGQLAYVYFETVSGPGSSTPSTNTAQTPSSSSGSYQVAKGSSAYLWTPQFASSAIVSQGTWVFDLWASCTASSAISISIFTTTSTGTIQSTILSGGSTNVVSTSETQVVSAFSGSQGTIPSNGYISFVLTVPSPGPRHCTVFWGNAQQTNFQVPYRILSS